MSETRNYSLYVEDDSTTDFIAWRRKMNGGDSYNCNMTKIDEILHDKADQSTHIDLTLSANGWTEGEDCFQQIVSVTGLSAEQNGTIGVAQSATEAQRVAAFRAFLTLTGQSDGQLTVTAYGKKPSVDIPVTVVLVW